MNRKDTTGGDSDARRLSDLRHIAVRIESDPARTNAGFAMNSRYVEQFWLSHIGPTALAVIRWISYCELPVDSADYTLLDVQLARQTIGVGRTGMTGRSGAFFKALDRLERFDFLRVDQRQEGLPSEITVYSHVSVVPMGRRRQWPPELNERHMNFLTVIAEASNTRADER